jgi:hypothetical protein
MTQKIAYDAASILSGAEGGAVFESRYWKDLGKDYANDAASSAISEAASNMFKLDVCQPPNLSANLNILLGLEKTGRPELKCKFDLWNDKGEGFAGAIGTSWKKWYELNKPKCDGKGGVAGCQALWLETKFNPNTSEAAASADAAITIGGRKIETKQYQLSKLLENKGIDGLIDSVSKKTKTPQQLYAAEVEELAVAKKQKGQNDALLEMSFSGKIWTALAAGMFSTFASTFLNNIAKAAMEGLFGDDPSNGGSGAIGSDSIYNPNKTASIRTLKPNPILIPKPIVKDLDSYNIVADYASCPEESGTLLPHPDHCVIDNDFNTGLLTAQSSPFTIQQAIDGTGPLNSPMLHGEWQLWGPDHPLDGTAACRKVAYCYSNIVKLRKARILPLGFEIAALLSTRTDGQPWTLADVVSVFNKYNPEDPSDCQDGHNRCGLIDPNWIIKSPPSACGMFGPGSVLAKANGPVRYDVCSDLKSCLAEEGGTCVGGFGYCTKERKIWRLDATTCPAQFNTCQTFSPIEEGKTGKDISLLTRTIDYGVCSADNVGCREYLSFKDGDDWVQQDESASPGYTTRLFLTGNAESCPDSQSGCTRLVVDTGPKYLKIAPPYLNCYTDDEQRIDYGDWPEDTGDLNIVLAGTKRNDEECANYAGVCIPEEVGCNQYAPTSFKGPSVPAVPKGQDSCPVECVGYDSYKQVETQFDEEDPLVYFIPSSAVSCPASEVGCDQYVNISEAERGGERLAYFKGIKSCRRPSDVDEDQRGVFFTWVGSESKGYELISFSLLQSTNWEQVGDDNGPGVPVPDYVESYDQAVLDDNSTLCNKSAYEARTTKPDCRELFDGDGNRFYRLISKTIDVDDSCGPFRKTEPSTYDVNVNQQTCTTVGGNWENNTCEVCKGGGTFQEGQCVYWVLGSKSASCSAEFSGCREYTGNFSSNMEVVYNNNFDDLESAQKENVVNTQLPDGDQPARLACEEDGGVVIGNTCKKCEANGMYDGPTDSCKVWENTEISTESTGRSSRSLKVLNNARLHLGETLAGEYSKCGI